MNPILAVLKDRAEAALTELESLRANWRTILRQGGYEIHQGTPEDGAPYAGHWWWTRTPPGTGNIEAGYPDVVYETADEAIAAAVSDAGWVLRPVAILMQAVGRAAEAKEAFEAAQQALGNSEESPAPSAISAPPEKVVNAVHPIQPLVRDEGGRLRFKANAIVNYLRENGGIDMNKLAILPFSREDREQFAQLIGYSHDGAGDLSYFSDDVWAAAKLAYESGLDSWQARASWLAQEREELKEALRQPIAALFRKHPDDLI